MHDNMGHRNVVVHMSALIIWAGIAVLVLLPPKYDPAIRWKEYNLRWAERIRKRNERN